MTDGSPVRVLVTGAAGQLGRELLRRSWPEGWQVVGRTSAQLDVTRRAAVVRALDELRPDIVVNAAAYTAVDRAEDEPDRAFAVNHRAVEHLAGACGSHATLVHISTDYVFDGTKDGWYVEDDPVCPIGVYGRSKAEGELVALEAERSLVLRTAWVYGALGANFVRTMLRLGQERDELGVVGDQWGCPTATVDLADAIIELVGPRRSAVEASSKRLFHVAAPDATNWYEFADAIFAASSGPVPQLHRLRTDEYPTRARRPANSRLATDRLASVLGRRLPSWRETLPSVVEEIEFEHVE